MRRLRLSWLGLLALWALCSGCASPTTDSEVEFRVSVFVREVETGTVEDRIVATGSLRAAETVALRADTAGVLVVSKDDRGRRLAEGDRVAAEQTIAEITGDEVRLAARSEATSQRYQTVLRDYESKKRLYEQGLLSAQEFSEIESSLADAKMSWEQSLLTESRSRLITPISGVILRLARDTAGQPLADGQLVQAGFEVAQIAPTGSLIADVDLVGSDISRVREGLQAHVVHHAWEDHDFRGRVVRLAPSLDPLTRTLRAEVAIDNREGLLRPGMFVEVIMIAARHEDVPVVPREAVAERGGRKVVFVLRGQQVDSRDVALGLGDDEIVEIREGLEPGERIVVRGIETLTDGTRVRVSGA